MRVRAKKKNSPQT